MKRPSFFPDWAAGASEGNLPAIQPPTDEERTQGIIQGRGLRRQVVNWMFQNLGQWVRYLEQQAFNPKEVFAPGLVGRDYTNLTYGSLEQPEGHIELTSYITQNGRYASSLKIPAYTYPNSSEVWWVLNRDLTFTPVVTPWGTNTPPALSPNQDACVYQVRVNSNRILGYGRVDGDRNRTIRFRRHLDALLWLHRRKGSRAATLARAEHGNFRVVYCLDGSGLYEGDTGPSIGVLVNAEIFVDDDTGREMVQCGSAGSSFFYVLGGDGFNILHHHPRLRSESTNNVLHNSTEGPWGQHWHVRNQLGGVRAEDLT